MILPRSVADPVLAHAVLHDLQPGDQLRVTGYLHLPRTPDEPMWLVVSELQVLQSAPLLTDPASVAIAVLERCGPYIGVFDAETTEVLVWTEVGVWVGTAPEPNELGELLEEFEQRKGTSGE